MLEAVSRDLGLGGECREVNIHYHNVRDNETWRLHPHGHGCRWLPEEVAVRVRPDRGGDLFIRKLNEGRSVVLDMYAPAMPSESKAEIFPASAYNVDGRQRSETVMNYKPI